MNNNKGVVYMAYGKERFLREAVDSLHSFKKIKSHENIPTTLISFGNIPGDIINEFDTFIRINDTDVSEYGSGKGSRPQTHHIKFLLYKYTPYDLTLFLDADTYICKDISWGFEIADKFKVAMPLADALYCIRRTVSTRFSDICHHEYTTYNSGVLFFKKDDFVGKIYSEAFKLCEKDKFKKGDQIYMTLAMYKNNFCPYTFHSRFMCKGYGYNMGNKKHCSDDWRNPNGPYYVLHHPRIALHVKKFVASK